MLPGLTVTTRRHARYIAAVVSALVASASLVTGASAAGAPGSGAAGTVGRQVMLKDAGTQTLRAVQAKQGSASEERAAASARARYKRASPGARRTASASTGSPQAPLQPALATPAAAAQTPDTQFTGATLGDSQIVPPDSMGAVGPTQFVVAVNGRVRSFNKATGIADGVLDSSTDAFFAGGRGTQHVSDPQVRYDRLSGRWIFSIVTIPTDPNPANRWLVIYSNTSTLTLATTFTGRVLDWTANNAGCVIDYDSLGVDANALYVGDNVLCGSTLGGLVFAGADGLVIPKAALLTGSLLVHEFVLARQPATTCTSGDEGPISARGVDNPDPAATVGYFAGTSICAFGRLDFVQVSNPGSSSPSIVNRTVTVAATAFPKPVPAMGSVAPLDSVDDRLFEAQLRNGHLWTAHNICVDTSGAATTPANGPCPAGSRVGSRWYDITGIGSTPSVNQFGTVFDPTGSNPRNYFIPSIMVSGQGHAAMGMSTAGTAEHLQAAYTGRLAGDAAGTMRTPTIYASSSSSYNAQVSPADGFQRWGDYSFTSLDPGDDMSMWTIQEYANGTDSWGVEVVRLLAPPPAMPASYVGTAYANQCAQQLKVTATSALGSGFFDPGAGFANHLSAHVSGGVTVNSIKYLDPTHVVLDINTQGVTPGTKNLTIVNPDGQQVQASNFITVVPASATLPGTESNTAGAQYTLRGSDGATWTEMDPNLRISCAPVAAQATLLSANVDLWTSNAGYNQDIGIFVSDNGAADSLLAWKESGGFAGTFSPNAAYVQHLFQMAAGHTYLFKLKWKANRPAGGATIWAGAGPIGGLFSPTSFVAKTFPTGVSPSVARSTKQYTQVSSDGTSWLPIDDANLSTSLSPSADSIAVLGANVDLFTSDAGYNQDVAIFVADPAVNGGIAQLVGWKESGGFAGVFSPNAAFLKATWPMSAAHTYTFSLKWKANRPASGKTIWAGAGPINAEYSPTSLVAETETATAIASSTVAVQKTLSNSDGTSWQEMDPNLQVSVTPGTDLNSVIGANADLFTSVGGYNQDIAIFVSDNGGADQLLAWKESGGFAGVFSPNAAFTQATLIMSTGHTYLFKVKWKANKPAGGATIWAGAGPIDGLYSPTRLTVETTS